MSGTLGRRVFCLLLLVLAVASSSCTRYVTVAEGADLVASADLAPGDELMVRLASGEIFHDTFVRFTEGELVCEGRTTEIEQIEYVRRRKPSEPDVSLFLGLGFVVAVVAILMKSADG